jgi:hypothetical protein
LASYETQLSSVAAVVACQQGGPIADRDERYGFRFEAHLAVKAEHGGSVRFDLLAPHVVPLLLLFTAGKYSFDGGKTASNILATPTSMRPSDSVCPRLLSTMRDDRWRRFQNRI